MEAMTSQEYRELETTMTDNSLPPKQRSVLTPEQHAKWGGAFVAICVLGVFGIFLYTLALIFIGLNG